MFESLIVLVYYLHKEIFIFLLDNLFQGSEPDIVNGVGAEAGQLIRTTIGGRNGQPKQVDRKKD